MIYFDTSYLVRLSYADPGADSVRALAATDHVASAAHGQAEMISVFHRKLREGAIPPRVYAALLDQVQKHNQAGAFHWLTPQEDVFSRVANVDAKLPRAVFLRAADAIHLATAAESGFGSCIRTMCICLLRQNTSISRAEMSLAPSLKSTVKLAKK